MSDGVNVGQAYIEITPKLRLQKAQGDIKRHLKDMAREVDREFNKQQRDLVGGFNRSMREFQKGGTKGVFTEIRAEMTSYQKLTAQLQKQQDAAMKQSLRAFDAEKKKISDSISAQKSLQRQKEDTLAADKRAQDRTIAELSAWYDKKHALEKQDLLEGQKAAKQYADDQAKAAKYRELRALGASPEKAALGAAGKLSPSGMGGVSAQMAGMASAAKSAGNSMARSFDNTSHMLSQLSTRIGLASFQLQLLGGFATTFLTGPALLGMGLLAKNGLQFAVNIDYARASMKSLLGPTADVEAILGRLTKLAVDSPLLSADDAITYAQQIAAVGVSASDLEPTIRALSNIMMTQGVAGPERAKLAMLAYTQILSKGYIGMDDLRQQFAEHVPGGIKIFQAVAHKMGFKTLDELRDAMKTGKVSAVELNDAFIAFGNSGKYIEGAAKASQTLGGVWQAFKEDINTQIGTAFDQNRKEIIDAINAIRPVVMSFIGWIIKNIPTMINWLGILVNKIVDMKAKYDALNPAQQQLITHIALLTLAAGPAAIAIGIFGTALSGLANAASLAYKGLALMVGIGGGPFGATVAVIVASIGLIITVVAVLYTKSEKMRLAVERAFNFIKDIIKDALLPAIDYLIGSVQSLEKTFGFLGFKSEDLAQVLRLLVIPFYILSIAIWAVVVVIKIIQGVMLVLSSIAYAVVNAIAYVITGFRELFQLLAKIPGAPKVFTKIADSADESAKKLAGLIDVSGQWKGLTEGNSHATEGLQKKLAEMDLTTTGLSGVFGGWNGIVDQSIQKQISLEEAINNARTAMQGQGSAATGLMDASDGYNKSLLTLKESIKQNGKGLNEHSQAGQRNRDSLKAASAASYEMMLQDIRSGVPMAEAIRRHNERTAALKKEFSKNKETQAAAQKLIDTYGKVPKDVATLLKMMGYKDVAAKMQEILAAQKVAANPGMTYGKALHAEQKAWAYEKSEGLKNNGVGKKLGGIIRGPGGPTGDKIPIMASDQEYMIRAAAARNLGKPMLDYINRTGALPVGGMYAKGGAVNWPMNVDMSKTKFPEMLGGDPNGGGVGWQKMMAVLRGHFPGLPLISGYRPGAITSTGNKSYHGMGRAVDLPPRWDVFNWISQNYGRGTKELIYTPAGGRQIKNGMPHTFSGGTIQEDHYNHVHWAYDNGGVIAPNQPFINKTGANELALNAAQGGALQQKIENSDRPVYVSVYVDGVKRDAEIVFDEKIDEVIQALGGV